MIAPSARFLRFSLPLVPTLLLTAAFPLHLGAACDGQSDRDDRGDRHGIDWSSIDEDAVVVARLAYVDDNAKAGETYPTIFNDPSVPGVQGTIHLDVYPSVPGAPLLITQELDPTLITTSFSSKSEGSLHRSVDGRYLTYMGYASLPGFEGVSNSYDQGPNTDLVPPSTAYPNYNRAVARISYDGTLDVTQEENAYSGDNPRGVLSIDGSQFYMVGNSDSTTYNSGTTGPGTTIGARYGLVGDIDSTKLATYAATDRPDESTKQHVKDNNFRGITLLGNTIVVSKGSGGNGDNGVFLLTAAGGVLPTPSTTNAFSVLFSTPADTDVTSFPFGIWFADENTLYVADEGNATALASGALPVDSMAGLEKWGRNPSTGVWSLLYTIQDGLDLLVNQNLSGFPVPTQTYGLRNIAGSHEGDGSVRIYAISAQYSSISGGEADPDKLVVVRDRVDATTLATHGGLDHFQTLQVSKFGEVFRGVSLLPHRDHARR